MQIFGFHLAQLLYHIVFSDSRIIFNNLNFRHISTNTHDTKSSRRCNQADEFSPLGGMLRRHEGKNNCKLVKTARLKNQAVISIILFPHKVYSDRQRATNDLVKARRFAPILYRNGKTIHRIVFPVSTDNSRKMHLWKHKEVGSRQQDENKKTTIRLVCT